VKILIVKLSSLGDVVHTMPCVQDILGAVPHAQIDWVVERGFAPLVQRCTGVRRVVQCEIRSWRKTWWRADTRAAWRAFKTQLQSEAYDAVIDAQGLTKSAIVARCARLAAGGKRFALAHATDGSGYEAPTRWLANVAIAMPPYVHAVQRARVLCAQALGYAVPENMHFGLVAQQNRAWAATDLIAPKTVVLVHGTSRDDKCWPVEHWVALGKQLLTQGYSMALVHGNAAEEARSQIIANALNGHDEKDDARNDASNNVCAKVWPRMPLDALTDAMALCAGVIGVDSGLSHIAVALDLPHVQIYNFDTAWRTGPVDALVHAAKPQRQRSVVATPPYPNIPSVDAVLSAWQAVVVA
jgi:heptosyltransferase I